MITSTNKTKEINMSYFLLEQAGGTQEDQLELDFTLEELLDYDLDSCPLTANQAG